MDRPRQAGQPGQRETDEMIRPARTRGKDMSDPFAADRSEADHRGGNEPPRVDIRSLKQRQDPSTKSTLRVLVGLANKTTVVAGAPGQRPF